MWSRKTGDLSGRGYRSWRKLISWWLRNNKESASCKLAAIRVVSLKRIVDLSSRVVKGREV